MSVFAELLPDAAPISFDTAAEPHEVMGAHGSLDRFSWLQDCPELASMSAYLDFISDTDAMSQLYFGAAKDQHTAFHVPAATMQPFLKAGTMFSVGAANEQSPGLRTPLEQLRCETSLSAVCVSRSIVYGSTGGSGAVWHWDGGANFVVQLQGTKRWHLAKNTHIESPPCRYAITMECIPERLRELGVDDRAAQGPDSWMTVDLVPGSVLYVPRGYWHSTESDGISLAVNFTYSGY